jgi:NADPH:quinone reductase-like Zn-dependent oxidoreductase
VPHDVIYLAEFETPRPGAGQALVEVAAAPINPADVLTLTGEYGQLPPLPAIGGREGVGRVAELGEDTRGVTVGQLVLLPLGCGTWSTHVITDAAQLTPLPSGADPLQRWFRHTPEQRRALVNEVASLIIAGKLHASIHATYDGTEIKQAAAAAAAGGRSVKILIVPRG